ncbi:MAG TPA: hypothetical protein VLG92_04760 [Candidatus Saccharimonadia bacterium]|nr:hypothetical protein [Candidatus Saccharimonadia bacterium]
MNPDGRWTATTPVVTQPQNAAAYQAQYPGDSTYLPQPDYVGHPAMRPTLPSPDRHRLRLLAMLIAAVLVLVTVIASLLVFHLATQKPGSAAQAGHTQSSGGPSVTVTSKSVDAKHKQDLKQLQTSLEAYFAKTRHYPTAEQMSTVDWLKANMSDLPQIAIADTTADPSLSGRPLLQQYTYAVSDATGASCEDSPNSCSLYTLTIPLSNGSAYTLHAASS